MKNRENLLTSKEVAAYFQRSPRTIRRWRAAGLLPWVSLPNGGVAFEMDAISAMVSQWAVGPTLIRPNTPAQLQK